MKQLSRVFIFTLSVIVSSVVSRAAKNCDPVQLTKGIACRCSATYCDEIEEHPAINPNEVFVYTSNEAGKRLELEKVTVPPSASVTTPSEAITVELDGKAHQKILGFGGAFTDAAAYVLSLLPGEAQKKLVSSYFSRKTGAKYTMGRVPLGSTDFSRKQYSLIQASNDFNTADFALQDDNLVRGVDYKLDLILRAQQEILQTSVNDTNVPFGINPSQLSKALSIFGSIWSVPVWMKTCAQPPAPGGINSCGTGFLASLYGRPKVPTLEFGGLNSTAAVRNAYARYWLKFLKAYAARGVELWGLTTQNEPAGNPTGNKWENTNYKPDDLASLVNTQLGPVLKAEFPNIKIMIGDDNYPELPDHASNANKSPYIDGVAYHWYYSMAGSLINTGKFGFEFFGGQKTVGEAYSTYSMTNRNGKKFLLMTEACTGYIDNKIEAGSWERGYNYLTSILHEVERGAAGWVDWNLALDMSGGPNHASNVVDAPILVDTAQGVFYKNPMYYTMSHFSAFVPPGAIRLGIANTDIGFIGSSKALEVIAFRRSETSTECVLIIANDHLTASLPTRGLSSSHTVLFKLPYNGNKIVIPMNDNEFKTVLFHCPLSATASNKEGSEEEAQSGLLAAFGGSKAAVAGVGAGVALVASMFVVVSVMLWKRPKNTHETTTVAVDEEHKDVEMIEERKPSL